MTSNSCPDKWIVPAGGVEPGEQYHDAAEREVLEEVSGEVVHVNVRESLEKGSFHS